MTLIVEGPTPHHSFSTNFAVRCRYRRCSRQGERAAVVREDINNVAVHGYVVARGQYKGFGAGGFVLFASSKARRYSSCGRRGTERGFFRTAARIVYGYVFGTGATMRRMPIEVIMSNVERA